MIFYLGLIAFLVLGPFALAASGRRLLALVPPVLMATPLFISYLKGPSLEEVQSAEVNTNFALAYGIAVLVLGAIGWIAGFAVHDLRSRGYFQRRRRAHDQDDT